jgi:hypothetical protein
VHQKHPLAKVAVSVFPVVFVSLVVLLSIVVFVLLVDCWAQDINAASPANAEIMSGFIFRLLMFVKLLQVISTPSPCLVSKPIINRFCIIIN